MHAVDIELLWWEGCPSAERALAELRGAVSDVGLPEDDVRSREIKTDADARETGFLGSPTILIDGEDLVGASPDDAVGLNCRVYRRRDGRISPTPDPDALRAALQRAAERVEAT